MVDLIVERGFELAAPSVEAEVEQKLALTAILRGLHAGEECVVARPCVVCGTLKELDVCSKGLGQTLLEQCVDGFGFGRYDEQAGAACYFECQFKIAFCNLGEHICPIRLCMGPCELNAFKLCPFRE